VTREKACHQQHGAIVHKRHILSAFILLAGACDPAGPETEIELRIANAQPSSPAYTVRLDGQVIATDFGLGATVTARMREGTHSLLFAAGPDEFTRLVDYNSRISRRRVIVITDFDQILSVQESTTGAPQDGGTRVRVINAAPADDRITVVIEGGFTMAELSRGATRAGILPAGRYAVTVRYGDPEVTLPLGEVEISGEQLYVLIAPGDGGAFARVVVF
jgi:hypothetical protein